MLLFFLCLALLVRLTACFLGRAGLIRLPRGLLLHLAGLSFFVRLPPCFRCLSFLVRLAGLFRNLCGRPPLRFGFRCLSFLIRLPACYRSRAKFLSLSCFLGQAGFLLLLLQAFAFVKQITRLLLGQHDRFGALGQNVTHRPD